MTDRELMQMALDALKEYVGVVVSVNDPNDWTPKVADAGEPARKAIEALRTRLAQPDLITPADVKQLARIEKLVEDVDPYTAPPQREWQGLTDEQVKQIEMSASSTLSAIYLAEAQLKGKNIG